MLNSQPGGYMKEISSYNNFKHHVYLVVDTVKNSAAHHLDALFSSLAATLCIFIILLTLGRIVKNNQKQGTLADFLGGFGLLMTMYTIFILVISL